MPFLLDILNKEPGHNFTAVIFVQIGVTLTPSSALYRLVKTITRSQYVARVSLSISLCFFPLGFVYFTLNGEKSKRDEEMQTKFIEIINELTLKSSF